jgi:hypothetical protein
MVDLRDPDATGSTGVETEVEMRFDSDTEAKRTGRIVSRHRPVAHPITVELRIGFAASAKPMRCL